jgi:cyclopropane fatty-acyl-phospholipid synthase-like methyltransferase
MVRNEIVSIPQGMEQLDLAGRLVGYSSGARYRLRGDFLFAGLSLANSHVLEVGCGTGAWATWAALHGAHRVVGIEPEAEGSSSKVLAQFQRAIETLGLCEQVEAAGHSLQDLVPSEQPFDVVVMYDVINHLDEDAVTVLHCDQTAFKRYVILLESIRSLMHPGGWVIVADCARDNFWNRLGLPAPLASSIEWHKHQNPYTWVKVFEHAGFQCYDLRWSPLQPFPRLTANWLVQYLTCSHFVLRLQVAEP